MRNREPPGLLPNELQTSNSGPAQTLSTRSLPIDSITITTKQHGGEVKKCYLILATTIAVVLGMGLSSGIVCGGLKLCSARSERNLVPPSPGPTVEKPRYISTPTRDSLQINTTIESLQMKSTLEDITASTKLRCGVVPSPSNGFNVDLCRGVAAAIFGQAEDGDVRNYEEIEVTALNRFEKLRDGQVDMLVSADTLTMERSVYEVRHWGHIIVALSANPAFCYKRGTLTGYAFSIPYLYGGLTFGGIEPFVSCADDLNVTDPQCNLGNGVKICVEKGTTFSEIIPKLLPDATIIESIDTSGFYRDFKIGACNVLAGDQFEVNFETVRANSAYSGPYTVGKRVHSNEPLAIVTRNNDAQWSDFVNWCLQALITAEEEGITKTSITSLPETKLFGDTFTSMFKYIIKEIGNYGQVFDRNMKELNVRRSPANMINRCSSGLIHPMPFGSIDTIGTRPVSGGSIQRILDRGRLICGISDHNIMFTTYNEEQDKYEGFDVDFCRALSAALFSGNPRRVDFYVLSSAERFEALANGDVDVLARVTTHTMQRDIEESTTRQGFSFSQPTFYDGASVGGIPSYVKCSDKRDFRGCDDFKACVTNQTTTLAAARRRFSDSQRIILPTARETASGIGRGSCQVVVGGVFQVAKSSIFGYDGPFQTSQITFSKDPLALVTRQDDHQWSQFVFWIVSALFYAEDAGITKATFDQMPEVNLFSRKFDKMLQWAVAAVGSYADVYDRNVQAEFPRGGLNALRSQSSHLHYPLPGLVGNIRVPKNCEV